MPTHEVRREWGVVLAHAGNRKVQSKRQALRVTCRELRKAIQFELESYSLPIWKRELLTSWYLSRALRYSFSPAAAAIESQARTFMRPAWKLATVAYPDLIHLRRKTLRVLDAKARRRNLRLLASNGSLLRVVTWSSFAAGNDTRDQVGKPMRRPGSVSGGATGLGLKSVQCRDAVVWGNSDFFAVENSLVVPDACDPERDLHPVENLGVVSFRFLPQQETQAVALAPTSRLDGTAVRLVGSCSGNYSHWLLEYLPRVMALQTSGISRDVPVLVDQWIHPRFVESMETVLGSLPSLVRLGRGQAIQVDQLIDFAHPNYHPPSFRPTEGGSREIPQIGDVVSFSKDVLDALGTLGTLLCPQDQQTWPRRLFLRRPAASTGNGRLLSNEETLCRILAPLGFAAVDPAALSFNEQVCLFRQAEFIVSPVGAALTSMVFCKPDTKIVALAPLVWKGDYSFFEALAASCGIELSYALGTSDGRLVQDGGQTYSVALSELMDRLMETGL